MLWKTVLKMPFHGTSESAVAGKQGIGRKGIQVRQSKFGGNKAFFTDNPQTAEGYATARGGIKRKDNNTSYDRPVVIEFPEKNVPRGQGETLPASDYRQSSKTIKPKNFTYHYSPEAPQEYLDLLNSQGKLEGISEEKLKTMVDAAKNHRMALSEWKKQMAELGMKPKQ